MKKIQTINEKSNIIQNKIINDEVIKNFIEDRSIRNYLGWIDLPDNITNIKKKFITIENKISEEKIQNIIFIGLGGSIESAKTILGLCKNNDMIDIFCLDTIKIPYIKRLEQKINREKSLFIFCSKSGKTIETQKLESYFIKKLFIKTKNIIKISDIKPKNENKYFLYVNSEDNIGGRYSSLSEYGILPAYLAGYDIDEFQKYAIMMKQKCLNNDLSNPAIELAAFLMSCYKNKLNIINIVSSKKTINFSLWLEQLISESLGKKKQGFLPIVNEIIKLDNSKLMNRIFLIIDPDEKNQIYAKELLSKNIPVKIINFPKNKFSVSGEFFKWQMAISILGNLMNINPFDQPNVEKSKNLTQKYLDKEKLNKSEYDDLNAIEVGKKINCVVLLNYSDNSEKSQNFIKNIQRLIYNKHEKSCIVLEAPRYLHSIGQLFKSGIKNIMYIFIENSYIVDENSKYYELSKILHAQALSEYDIMKKIAKTVLRLRV